MNFVNAGSVVVVGVGTAIAASYLGFELFDKGWWIVFVTGMASFTIGRFAQLKDLRRS